MRKQKRYTTRETITKAIEAAKLRLAELIAMANDEDSKAKDNYKAWETCKESERAWYRAEGNKHAAERDKLFRSADRVEQITIAKLGRTLAEFDTQPMPVAGLDDDAVVLAR